MIEAHVTRTGLVRLLAAAALATLVADAIGAEQAAGSPAVPACAKIWLGREPAIEDAMRAAEIKKIEDVPIGVTRPKRVYVQDGLPFRRMAWKPIRPGMYGGYRESYKAEIAAYELDKLLGVAMIPPTVERRVNGELGAAVLWVEDVSGWDMKKAIVADDPAAWSRQVVRMKMFDQLTGNIDRNQGNLLYDAEFHLILIDHSRALTGVTSLKRIAKPTRIDKELWDKIAALDAPALDASLGQWMVRGDIAAILKRRETMRQEVEALVAREGDAAFLR